MKSKRFMRDFWALCFELNCGGPYARNGRSASCRSCKGLTCKGLTCKGLTCKGLTCKGLTCKGLTCKGLAAWLLGGGVATGMLLLPQLEPIRSKLSRAAAELIKHGTLNIDNEDNVD
jgi:hypothetical protein